MEQKKKVNKRTSARKTVASVTKELKDFQEMHKSSTTEMLEAMSQMAFKIEELNGVNAELTSENEEKENVIQAILSLFTDIKAEWEGKNAWNRFWISVKFIGEIFDLFTKVLVDTKYNF